MGWAGFGQGEICDDSIDRGESNSETAFACGSMFGIAAGSAGAGSVAEDWAIRIVGGGVLRVGAACVSARHSTADSLGTAKSGDGLLRKNAAGRIATATNTKPMADKILTESF